MALFNTGRSVIGIAGDGSVVDLAAGRIVEGQDQEVREVEPTCIKQVMPIKHEPFGDGAAVQASAKRVEDEAHVNREKCQGTYVE